jgi:hypothetical protein
MDIEGAEFRVLRHVLLSQPAALCGLAVLAVEWHDKLMTRAARLPANLSGAFRWLLSGQPGCDVGVVSWH